METKKNSLAHKNKKELNVYEKRFLMMMKLFRIGQMMKTAKITYPPSK